MWVAIAGAGGAGTWIWVIRAKVPPPETSLALVPPRSNPSRPTSLINLGARTAKTIFETTNYAFQRTNTYTSQRPIDSTKIMICCVIHVPRIVKR